MLLSCAPLVVVVLLVVGVLKMAFGLVEELVVVVVVVVAVVVVELVPVGLDPNNKEKGNRCIR